MPAQLLKTLSVVLLVTFASAIPAPDVGTTDSTLITGFGSDQILGARLITARWNPIDCTNAQKGQCSMYYQGNIVTKAVKFTLFNDVCTNIGGTEGTSGKSYEFGSSGTPYTSIVKYTVSRESSNPTLDYAGHHHTAGVCWIPAENSDTDRDCAIVFTCWP